MCRMTEQGVRGNERICVHDNRSVCVTESHGREWYLYNVPNDRPNHAAFKVKYRINVKPFPEYERRRRWFAKAGTQVTRGDLLQAMNDMNASGISVLRQ